MLITGEHSVLGDTVYLYDEFNRAVGSDILTTIIVK